MDNFLIIRLSSLGDIIHTLPAFAALRKKYPAAKITWAVEEKGKEILDLVPGIDEVVVIPKKGWHKAIPRIRRKDQTALDFQGLAKSALLTFLCRSKKRIGFHQKNCKEPIASHFYTDRLEELPEEGLHVISKNLRLLSRVGVYEEKYEFPLFISSELREAARAELKETGYNPDQKLVILNMGAAWETKRWFPEKWKELAEKLRPEGAFLLLLWGNDEEQQLALAVQEQTAISLAPFLSVKEVIALIKQASLLISGDTFALQAACALSIPTVAIFGPTNPLRNGPFNPRDKVAFHKLDCNPCYKKVCPTLECLKMISPEEVASLALQALKQHV